MRFERMITAIDTHTGGEPTRNVTGGLPRISGATASEKMVYLRDHMDWLRTMLMQEPRGHSVMSGALLFEPSDPRADFGVVYIEAGGYLPMCGHDTIGCCTALVEAGMVPVTEPITRITLETPAGLVETEVHVQGGVAKSVTLTNIPSFLYKQDVAVKVPGFGTVTMDIAYGGNFYAILKASDFGLEIEPKTAGQLVRVGHVIRDAVNEQIEVVHPEKPFIRGLTHVEFYGPPKHPEAHCQNAVLITGDALDRSPCGTGTSAKLATLFAKGLIGLDQEFIHESIIGTIFSSRVIGTTEVAGYTAVIPQITGSAYVTGIHQFVVDPDDPLKAGFLLGE